MKQLKRSLRGQLSDIDIRLLRVFKGVVDHGGYSKAEIALNINRSTISIHMSDLETRLGMSLCNRGRGRSSFSLTDQGREVYKAIADLFTDLNRFRDRVNAIQSQLSGELRIALPDDILEISQIDLISAIAGFCEKAPDVNIEVIAHSPNEVDLDILNGHADCGINVAQTRHPGLEYLPLFEHSTGLYCGQQHPLFRLKSGCLTLEKVIDHHLVGSNSRYDTEIHQRHAMFKIHAHASHMSGRCLLILSGTHIGFLPDYFAKRWVESGQLKKIDLQELNYTMHNALISKRNADKKVLIQLFTDELLKQISPESD
ncbi:MAG: LysR family transcriptional regulator [Gammaproteobacteria bacterium]|nr:LysR family transcriptional regulator [Gammaproteobacteria bacterium]